MYDGIHEEIKECVGHIQKRVGTALRKLKKENKGIGGNGKLTDAMFNKLQNYYGIAIRSNFLDLEDHLCMFIIMSLCFIKKNLHHHCPDIHPTVEVVSNKTKTIRQVIMFLGPGLPDDIIKLINLYKTHQY